VLLHSYVASLCILLANITTPWTYLIPSLEQRSSISGVGLGS
jgi:hypothetical protein